MSITAGLTASQLHNATVMVATVKAHGLPKRAAVVVIETAMVESGIRVYANPNVPESMRIPHEAEGTDHASVGPLQQQVPSWGTAADCMDPARSTLKFLYGAGNNPGLLTLPGYRFAYVNYPGATSWTQIPTGSAAQAVQVSAFPDRYQQQEPQATQLVDALWGSTAAPDAINVRPLSTEDDDMYLIFTFNKGIWMTPISYAYKRGFKNTTALKQWEADVKALGGKFKITNMDASQAASIPTGAGA